MFLYLTKDALYLKKSGGRLIIEDIEAQSTQEIPISLIEGIVIFGRIQLSTDVIRAMLKTRTPVFFLSKKGSYFGKLDSLEIKNVALLYNHSRLALDEQTSLAIAKIFVSAKIWNSRVMLMRRSRFFGYHLPLPILRELDSCRLSAIDAISKESLRGIEGHAAKIYFDAFGSCIKEPFFFRGRNRRPPLDPVNAMLSLGYTLLAQTITMILDVQGINGQIGFFHQPKDLRSLLVLDIMEQYRAWIVDDMVVRLVHHNKINLDHFVIDEQDEKKQCRLTDDGLKIFLNEYYRLMFKEKDNGNLDALFIKLKILEKDIEGFKQHIIHPNRTYGGFLLK